VRLLDDGPHGGSGAAADDDESGDYLAMMPKAVTEFMLV